MSESRWGEAPSTPSSCQKMSENENVRKRKPQKVRMSERDSVRRWIQYVLPLVCNLLSAWTTLTSPVLGGAMWPFPSAAATTTLCSGLLTLLAWTFLFYARITSDWNYFVARFRLNRLFLSSGNAEPVENGAEFDFVIVGAGDVTHIRYNTTGRAPLCLPPSSVRREVK